MIKQISSRTNSEESQSPSNIKNIQKLPASPQVRLTSLIVGVIQSVIIQGQVNYTFDNYRLMVTDKDFMIIPLVVVSIALSGIICFEAFYRQGWDMDSYYWYICTTMCHIFWILTFSTGTQDSNKSSLVIIIAILFSSVKLYKSLYQPQYRLDLYYFQRNLVAFIISQILILCLINFGIVMVFQNMIKQRSFTQFFFAVLPIFAVAFFVLMQTNKPKQDNYSSFLYWVGIIYGAALSGYNYYSNDLFTYQRPYYS